MGREMTRDEARELLGAYALGAVDADERAEIERHLLDDPEARAELHALQLGAAWLERSAERPSPEVWGAIAGRRDASDAAHHLDLDARSRAGIRWGTGPPEHADRPASPAPPPRPAPPRRAHRTGRTALAIAAAIAVVAVVGGGIRTLVGGEGVVDRQALADAIASAPGAESVTLTDADGAETVVMVLLPDGSGLVTDAGLPDLSAARTYQLWAITDDGPQSVAVLGPEPGLRAVNVPTSATALAVTAEPRGGSPEPTGRVVARTRIAPA